MLREHQTPQESDWCDCGHPTISRHVKKNCPKGHGPVTMAMAANFEAGGQYALADIARKYAVDRPRWWHRFTKRGSRC